MSGERLESLVQINTEHDIANKIELDSLLESFKLAKSKTFIVISITFCSREEISEK